MDMTWLGPCWEGIDCGDAGGWLSGFITAFAIGFGYWQFLQGERSAEKKRREEVKERRDAICRVLFGDVLTLFIKSSRDLQELNFPLHEDTLKWIASYQITELADFSSVRPQIMELDDDASVVANQLLMTMRSTLSEMRKKAIELETEAQGSFHREMLIKSRILGQNVAYANIRHLALSAHGALEFFAARDPRLGSVLPELEPMIEMVRAKTKPTESLLTATMTATAEAPGPPGA